MGGGQFDTLQPFRVNKILCQGLNRSIEITRFPSLMKSANTTPVFKKDDRADNVNYRPASFRKLFV